MVCASAPLIHLIFISASSKVGEVICIVIWSRFGEREDKGSGADAGPPRRDST